MTGTTTYLKGCLGMFKDDKGLLGMTNMTRLTRDGCDYWDD